MAGVKHPAKPAIAFPVGAVRTHEDSGWATLVDADGVDLLEEWIDFDMLEEVARLMNRGHELESKE